MVKDGLLSAGHARVLAGISDPEKQMALARKAVAEGLNVRQMEQEAAALTRGPKKKKDSRPLPAELGELQEKIRMKTGLKSTLTGSINRGRIVLQYTTREELERLNDMLDGLAE
jgi:ParB family chromosome partitioning protein